MDMVTSILLAIASMPVFVLLVYIYRQDKVEKEPIGLLCKLLILGALTCVSAYFLEILGEALLAIIGAYPGTLLYYFLDAFFVVGCAEELGKYVVLKKNTWNHRAFDYRFDGIVYSVCVGLGFALLENILYVFGAFSDSGFLSATSTGMMRGILSIPGHCIFAIFMGYYYGEAKLAEYREQKRRQKRMLRKAFWSAVCIHGFYDFCLFTGESLFMVVFYVFVVYMDIKAFKRVRSSSDYDMPLDA